MKTLALITGMALLLFVLAPGVFAAGPAFSGLTATADSAETVTANPAGMTRFKKPEFYAAPMLLYTESKTEFTAGETGEKQTTDNDSLIVAPGLYYLRPLNDRWAIGIGPNAVMGLGATYDDKWAGRYLLEEWSLSFAGIAPAAAYRVNDNLSLGASLPVMYSQYRIEKAVYNLDPEIKDGNFELETDGWGMGVNIGLLYELTRDTRFGVVYRSKVSVTEEGEPDFSGLTAERKQLLDQFGVFDGDISIDTSTPQAMTAGLFHDLQNGFSLSLDLAWMDFSEWGLEDVEIGDTSVNTRPGDYKDIWAGSFGLNYEVTPQWTTRGGVFYVSSPLDREDRTAFTRFDRFWGCGLGAEHKFVSGRRLSFDLTYIQFGDGKFRVEDAPLAGEISGEYTKNYGLVFDVGTSW